MWATRERCGRPLTTSGQGPPHKLLPRRLTRQSRRLGDDHRLSESPTVLHTLRVKGVRGLHIKNNPSHYSGKPASKNMAGCVCGCRVAVGDRGIRRISGWQAAEQQPKNAVPQHVSFFSPPKSGSGRASGHSRSSSLVRFRVREKKKDAPVSHPDRQTHWVKTVGWGTLSSYWAPETWSQGLLTWWFALF